MSDERQPRVIGFVSGSQDEQEEQKSNIEKYYDTSGYYSDKGVIFPPGWNKIKEDLKRGDLKRGDVIIIDDLKRLAGDWGVLANRLLALTNNSVHVDTVNEEQRKLLNWDERLKHNTNLISIGAKERALVNLKELAIQILQGTES